MNTSIPVSNAKELSQIRTRHQNRNVNSTEYRPIVGVDTETHNGDIFLIADSEGNTLEYPNISFETVAKFLLHREGKWIFFYNLGYDAECILKLLPVDVLQGYRKIRRLAFEYKGFSISYIDRKLITIRQGKHSASCYDIAQYYDNKRLEVAYNENIGEVLDSEYLSTKNERSLFTLRHFLRHKKRIRRYCIQDCLMTKELAENWANIFRKQFGFYPARWVSAGYLAEKVLINEGVRIPYFNDLPYALQEMAWQSFYGGRFELIRKGFIGTCYLYDINSAYPHALTKLPDLQRGTWEHGNNAIHDNAALGFFRIRALIDNSVKIAPFPFRTKNGMIIYPVGEFETFVTLDELRSIKDDQRIRYRILDSFQFIPKGEPAYPFKEFISGQYSKRMQLQKNKDPLERAVKLILNSIYGKMAQRVNGVIGNLFNPVIASFITGYTRAQLYNFMRENRLDREIVAFATDSIACRRKIEGIASKDLGKMKLDKEGDDAIFLSNGFYRFNGVWKQRGVGYDKGTKALIEHHDTRMGEDGQLYIAVKTMRTTHIRTGICYNKHRSIGRIEEYEKKIGLNSDKKRFWADDLCSLNDGSFCDSAPLNINEFADILANQEIAWEDEKYDPLSEL